MPFEYQRVEDLTLNCYRCNYVRGRRGPGGIVYSCSRRKCIITEEKEKADEDNSTVGNRRDADDTGG